MGIGSNVKSRMARADDSGTKNANPDPKKIAHDTVIAVDQALQAALNCALSTREMLRSLDEKETKMHGDCNPKSQIATILHQITKSAERELENILRKTKAWNDECIDLYGSMQDSIKKTDIARLKTTLMAKLSVQNAQASALESRLIPSL